MTSPQARKKCPQLPEMVEARLLTRILNGKERQVLTSMVDPMRFPGADIVDLYSHRWEIELGYREMKHSQQARSHGESGLSTAAKGTYYRLGYRLDWPQGMVFGEGEWKVRKHGAEKR